ncbi:cyclic nucleotide-binding domain protein (macronuclear) [Tetrahymena thermophila SB210]|uniref:Cyclic nucleotide-binding domain protein n=1 Tax=Tetrahymena thermophila (strain SB210) TaxID=312017 RepID=I7MJ88_TETTS|nr:cyclic nucleotide-binding domain protein [Tetrahymena thermophila SB210]EAS05991.2 cyclic nucleotide-binding domain protein [Tetrahymena thermophila SB210]|eukprot:XP_001026236.2 cyclic nucleotide-binding domain protein [Tetrahymena thermophila SB210]
MKKTQERQELSELEVRTNQQIKELHKKKLDDLVEKEYNSKKTTCILPQLERQNIVKNESDVLYAVSEIKQFPIIQDYQMKDIECNKFCYHFIEQMQYTVVQLGEQILYNYLTEDIICFLLKGKVSIYQEKTTSQIEEDLIEYFKVHYHQISLQIKENNLQTKLREFMKDLSSSANKKIQQTSNQISKGSSKEIQQDDQIKHYFDKEELRILQSIVRELIIKGIFQLIDQQAQSQMDLHEQQQILLLWYQPRTDYYFNEWGIPKYFEVQSFYSGDHFSSQRFFQEKEKQVYLMVAADDLHMITMKRSSYESISNYQPDSQKEKLKFIGDKFKDISKNTVLKFIYHFKKKEFKRKEHLWRENEKVEGIYFIQSGEVEYLKSYKTKSSLIKKQDNLNQQEMELIVKNDQKVQLLQVCTFHQGDFIGEEDLFESIRSYSAVAKSEIVIIQYLSLDDLGIIKNFISEIYSQLTSRIDSKKRNLDQKLNIAIQNNNQKGDQKSIIEILSNQKHSRQLKNLNEKDKKREIQKLIETKEQTKFTNTNDIKQIDKLIRSEFGKKRYLQMIKDNPQIVLSNSTLNSLESVMSFTDIQKKQEQSPQKDERNKLSIQQSKQNKNISQQQSSSQNCSFLLLNDDQQKKKNSSQQDLKNQMRKSIKNVMNLNKFLFKFKTKKDSSKNSEDGSNIPSYNDFFSNEVDTILDSQKPCNSNNSQPKLTKVQSSNSSYQQPLALQPQISSSITGSSNPQKDKQKKITYKERQQIQQQKLMKEINSQQFQNLKHFLSNKQIEHLAIKKLTQKENYKDRNKLTIFEQQQVKKSLLEKPIRQGQKNVLTDEQKMQIKTALQSLLLNNSQKLESDFIFKGVQTQQSIKQLQLKMYQKLQQKPGMQSLCLSPHIKSKRSSLANSLAVSRKQSQQLEIINQLQLSQPNSPTSSDSSPNIFKSTHLFSQNSNQMKSTPQNFSPLSTTDRFFEQSCIKQICNDHVNDSVIEESKSNRQKIGCNSLSVDTSYSILTEQSYQQNQLAICVHRRVQSGKARIQLNKPQSPILFSRNHNPKYQFSSSFSSSSNNQTAKKYKQNDIQIEQPRYQILSIQNQLNNLKQNQQNIEITLKTEPQNLQKSSLSQMLDSSKNIKTDTIFKSSIRCNNSTSKLHDKQKQESSISNIAQINNSTVCNTKRDSAIIWKGIEKNLQSQSNPYLNNVLIDNQNLDYRDKFNQQARPISSQVYSNLKTNTRNQFINTQFINKVDEKSPIVIKSLQLNDFINFDKLRLNPKQRPNSSLIASKTSPTQPNIYQKQTFMPTEVSYQNNTSLASPSNQQSQINNLISSKNSVCFSQLRTTLNLNSPLIQSNRKFFQSNIQDIQNKTSLSYQQKQNLTQNQSSPKVSSIEQQKILPFKRIHSATARKKLKKNTVINQIINQYKKSNGLILVPNDLLISENNNTSIK